MRVGAARTSPIARHRTRRLDHERPPIAIHRRSSARAGVHVGGVALSFLVGYITLRVLHAFGRDPQIIAALGSIPLFSRFMASTTCALAGGLAIGLLVRDPARFLRHLPALLAAAIALFVVTVVFFS